MKMRVALALLLFFLGAMTSTASERERTPLSPAQTMLRRTTSISPLLSPSPSPLTPVEETEYQELMALYLREIRKDPPLSPQERERLVQNLQRLFELQKKNNHGSPSSSPSLPPLSEAQKKKLEGIKLFLENFKKLSPDKVQEITGFMKDYVKLSIEQIDSLTKILMMLKDAQESNGETKP